MGVAATLAPKGLGPQDPIKKLAHRVELLGKLLSQKNVFENLGPEPPSPLKCGRCSSILPNIAVLNLGAFLISKSEVQIITVQSLL